MREEGPYGLLCAACPRAFQSRVWKLEPFPVWGGCWSSPSPQPLTLTLAVSAKGTSLCTVPFLAQTPTR